MKPRERVINTIERRAVDRLAIDGWMRPETWLSLRKHFGVETNEDVMKALGIDIRTVYMTPPKGFTPKYVYPPQRLSKDLENLYATLFDEWHIGRQAGSTGEYWHFTYHPLQHSDLDAYEFPDLGAEGRFDGAKELVREYSPDYAVAGYAIYGIFEHAWALRGYETFIRDMYTNPAYAERLLDRLLDWKIEWTKRLSELGVDIVQVGDDLGTQTGLMLPPRLIKRYLIPRYKTWFRVLKNTGVYVFFHCDGKIDEIIPDLIETGIDILNPVQPECMNPAEVKEKYGSKITIHGCISVQQTLPFGTADDVRREVSERIRTLGYDGGYIVAPAHTIDKHIPLQNVLALYETAREYQF